MSRTLSTTLGAALEDDELSVFFCVDLEFDSTPVRFWTGLGEITIDSKTYTGAGHLLKISAIQETSEVSAQGASISLSGVPANILSLALVESYQYRICRIYMGIMTNQTEYTEIFSGYMDQMSIEEGGDTSVISLSVENKLIDLERLRVARFTAASQNAKYPNDRGLDFVEDLQDKEVVWGRKSGS